MRAMVERAMKDGALGLSTGLIYPPGMYSDTEELKELARVVAEYGGVYTSHIRGSSETLIPVVKELLEVGRETGVRVHHSHNEAVGRENWPKIDRALAMEEEAERQGGRLASICSPTPPRPR
jgi:N-acyl-D-amino-acid deacylase